MLKILLRVCCALFALPLLGQTSATLGTSSMPGGYAGKITASGSFPITVTLVDEGSRSYVYSLTGSIADVLLPASHTFTLASAVDANHVAALPSGLSGSVTIPSSPLLLQLQNIDAHACSATLAIQNYNSTLNYQLCLLKTDGTFIPNFGSFPPSTAQKKITAGGRYFIFYSTPSGIVTSDFVAFNSTSPLPSTLLWTSGTSPLACGQTATLAINPTAQYSKWYKNNTLIASGVTTLTIGQKDLDPGINSYQVQVSNDNVCFSDYSNAISLSPSVSAGPVLSLNGNATVGCGQSATLTLNSTFPFVRWYKNNVLDPTSTGSSISLDNTSGQLPAGSFQYKASVSTDGLCYSDFSNAISVTVQSFLPGIPSLNASVSPINLPCNQPLILTVIKASTDTATYRYFKLLKDGVQMSLQNSPVFPIAQTGNYTAQASVNGLCYTPLSNLQKVGFVNSTIAAPQLLYAGNTTIVCNQPKTLTVSSTGHAHYRWYKNDSLYAVDVSSLVLHQTDAGTYQVQFSDDGNCFSPLSPAVSFNTSTSYTIAIGGSGTSSYVSYALDSGNNVLSVKTSDVDPSDIQLYQWEIASSSGTWVSISGANAATYAVQGPGTYRLRTQVGTCTQTSNQVTVISSGNPIVFSPVVGSNNLVLCHSNAVLTATTGFARYIWTLNNTVVQDGTSNQLSLPLVNAANYTVTGVDNFGYHFVSPVQSGSITVLEDITPTITTNGRTFQCTGQQVDVSISSPSSNLLYQNYVWKKDGVLIVSGSNVKSVSVGQTGSYTLSVTDFAGCTASSPGLPLTQSSTPPGYVPQIASQDGSLVMCANTGKTLSLQNTPPAGGNYVYQWYKDGIALAVQTQLTPTVIYQLYPNSSSLQIPATGALNPGSGVYTLKVTDVNGNICIGNSNGLALTVNPVPVPSFTTSPTLTKTGSSFAVCSGDAVTLQTNQVTGYTYQWGTIAPPPPGPFNSPSFSPIAGATGTSITFQPIAYQNYQVLVTDGNGCQSDPLSNVVSFSVNTKPTSSILYIPAIPTASPAAPPASLTICSGDRAMLFSTVANVTSYAWYKDGVSVSSDPSISLTQSGIYYLVANNNGCVVQSATCTVSVISPPVDTFTVTGAVLGGASVQACHPLTFTAADAPAGQTYTYAWTTTSTSGVLGTSKTLTRAASSALYLSVANAGCSRTSPSTTVTINTPPVLAVTNPGAFCSPNTVNLSTTFLDRNNTSGTVTYWKDAQASQPLTSSTVGVSGTYYIKKVTPAGCMDLQPVTVVVNTAHSITSQPVGATAVCPGSLVTLAIATSGTNTCQWQYRAPGSSTFATVTATFPYQVSSTPTGSTLTITAQASLNNYEYRCVVSGPCAADLVSASAFLALQPSPLLNTNPILKREVCEGATTTFSVTATGSALTYQWQMNQGNGFQNLVASANFSNVTSPTLTVAAIPLSFHRSTFRCIVTGTCSLSDTSSTGTLSVTAKPALPVLASTTAVCSGNALTLQANLAAGASARWYTPSNTLIQGSGNNVSVTPPLNNGTTPVSSTYSVEAIVYSDTIQCLSPRLNVPVTVNPLPLVTATITGSNPICSGQSTALLASGAIGYLWNTGANTAATTISTSANTTYSVTGTDQNGCQGTASVTVTATPLPPVPSFTMSKTTACSGDTIFLQVPMISPYAYSLGRPNGTIEISYNSTTSVFAEKVTQSGSFRVAIKNLSTGCINSSSQALVVNASLPSPNVSLSATALCPLDPFTVTVTNTSGYVTTLSGIPSGSSLIASNTTSNGYVSTYAIGAVSGNVTAKMVSSANGCSTTQNYPITSKPLPAVTKSTNISICNGTSATLDASSPDAASYKWYLASNSNSTSGQVLGVGATYTTPALDHTTNYLVRLVGNNGCTNAMGTPFQAIVKECIRYSHDFDGVKQYAQVDYAPSLTLDTGPFTFEALVKPSKAPVNSVQLLLSNRSSQSAGFMFGFMGKKLYVQLGGGPNIGYDQGPDVLDGGCHHVAVTRDASFALRFYVDGVLTYQTTSARDISSTSNWSISYDAVDNGDYFKGQIDELRVWNTARAQTDLVSFAQQALNGNESGLLANWLFDESGQVLADNSIHGFNGHYGSTLNADVNDPPRVLTDCNYGLRFDGADDRAELAFSNDLNVGTGPFTMEAFVNPDASATNTVQMILSNRASGNYSGFMFGMYQKRFYMQLNGVNYAYSNTPLLNDNACHHFAATRDASGVVKFYVDGTLYYQTTSLSNLSSNASWMVGNDRYDSFMDGFKGTIDEIRLWSIPLSANQLAQFANQKLVSSQSGLVADWRMTESQGQQFTDIGNKYLATLGSTTSSEVIDPTWTTINCGTVSVYARMANDEAPTFENDVASNEATVRMLPNPFQHEVTITLSGLKTDENVSVQVMDMQGVVLEEKNSTGDHITMGETLASGVYVVVVHAHDKLYSYRAVKLK